MNLRQRKSCGQINVDRIELTINLKIIDDIMHIFFVILILK